MDITQVGRELGVRYVVEGSVRHAGNRLRISGQLIDATAGTHLWADRFDGTMDELFDLQDQVATSIVGAITPKVEEAEIERSKRKPTDSLDAYDYYLRGLAKLDRTLSKQAIEDALKLFKEAIARDSDFAPAYARAARCYGYLKVNGWMADYAAEVNEAVILARKAIDFGRDDALALAYGGFVLGYVGGDLAGGAAYIDRALALNPNLAEGWGMSSSVRAFLGNFEPAIKHAALAMQLSPLDPRLFVWQFNTGLAHFLAGRYDEGVVWGEEALRQQPNYYSTLRLCAACYSMVGRFQEAQAMIVRLTNLDPDMRLSNLAEVLPPFRRPGDLARYLEGLRRAGLPA